MLHTLRNSLPKVRCFGNARQVGGGPNPARQISIRSGVPQEVPA